MSPIHRMRILPPRVACRLGRSTASFRDDRRGAVAIIFAITIAVIMLCLTGAINYAIAQQAKARLSAIADMAALTAARSAALGSSAAEAAAAAERFFRAQTQGMGNVDLTGLKVNVTDKGGIREVNVSYDASIENMFMGEWFRRSAGSTSASSQRPQFADFYLLLDNTPSMGLPSTQAGIDKMRQLTAGFGPNNFPNCAFACHEGTADDRLTLARNNGIATRVDAIRTATETLLATATRLSWSSRPFQVALYDYGQACQPTALTEISPLTSNFDTVRNDLGKIQLMLTPTSGVKDTRCTDHRAILQLMTDKIPARGAEGTNGTRAGGSGESASDAKQFLIIVTDGLTNTDLRIQPRCDQPIWERNRCVEPFDPATCKKLKDNGVQVAVLYTTYLPLDGDDTYDRLRIATYQAGLVDRMKQCVSDPNYFTEVRPGERTIEDALNALFLKLVASVRLTT